MMIIQPEEATESVGQQVCQSCDAIIVRRYVRSLTPSYKIGGGVVGPYVLDQEPDESVERLDTPNIGVAPDDSPEGFGVGIPFTDDLLYRLPWTFDFLFEAVCVKGEDAGKVISTIQKLYIVEGHRARRPYRGKFLDEYREFDYRRIMGPGIVF